jgi:hypothetical protein
MRSGNPDTPKYPAAVETVGDSQPGADDAAHPLPHTKSVRHEMEQSDREMIRVYEDLVDLLVHKNLVLLTDLPIPAQQKLLRRKRLRAMLSPLADIINTEDEGSSIP